MLNGSGQIEQNEHLLTPRDQKEQFIKPKAPPKNSPIYFLNFSLHMSLIGLSRFMLKFLFFLRNKYD